MLIRFILPFLLFLFVSFSNWVLAAKHALVIGNSSYELRPLDDPKNDATDIAQVLRGMDFTVTEAHDVIR
jgi:hypothetical protein